MLVEAKVGNGKIVISSMNLEALQDKYPEAEALRGTVERFNGFCAAGEDEDFHRGSDSLGPVQKPPFYALPLFPGGPNTKGGLKANEKRQVVDWSGNVIPRLYAAGEIASAFKYVYQSGGNVAECIVFGRVAGLNAAKEPDLD
jgi:succinate dehydrogenase/fumarate reductase flavoprotein subunit